MKIFARTRRAARLALLCAAIAAGPQAVAEDYRIDSERSSLRVLVYRGGLLGGLGHNHVIAHRNLNGSVVVDDETSLARVTMTLAVADFIIDEPRLRRAEGDDFPGEMTPQDIAGTRQNMLGRELLYAGEHPEIAIAATLDAGAVGAAVVDATLRVRDRRHPLRIPVTIERTDGGFVVRGELSVSHQDVGLRPFTAALGALRVRDELTLKLDIRGHKAPGAPQ